MPNSSRLTLEKVLDVLLDTVVVVNGDSEIVFVSASCEELLGYTQAEMLGRNIMQFILPEDRERTKAAAAAVMHGQPHIHFENRYIRKDGSIVDIMWSARWSEKDQLRFGVARNITELKNAERKQVALYEISEAAHTTENMASLYQHIHRVIAGLLHADLFFATRYDKATNMLSFPYFSGDLPEKPAPQLLNPESRLAAVIRSGQTLLLSSTDSATAPVQQVAGLEAFQEWLGVPLTSQSGVIGAIVMARRTGRMVYTENDRGLMQFVGTQVATAIERKQTEARLQHIASHDALTDIPNRMLLMDRLEVALKRAHRDRKKLVLLYLDLNGFKEVNDSAGHHIGDLLLCEMARRLSGSVRDSDTVARMGGDEFAILVPDAQELASADAVIEKVRIAAEMPFELEGHTLRVSASIGAALYPDDGESAQDLVRAADHRMYVTKQASAN